VASEAEIRLGRLAVERGLATEEQVLAALRERNAEPEGADLGDRLTAAGVLAEGDLRDLRAAVAAGAAAAPRPRHEAATDLEIPLGPAREMIARESLNEIQSLLPGRQDEAAHALRRLSEEFPDTESGNRARTLLRELEEGRP